jgi:hypothetical protein
VELEGIKQGWIGQNKPEISVNASCSGFSCYFFVE